MKVLVTETFDSWLTGLRDRVGRSRIQVRVDRLAGGNPGDQKSVGDGVIELRITSGPGYRVYYVHRETAVILLLAGGDKSTQAADIAKAKALAAELEKTKWPRR